MGGEEEGRGEWCQGRNDRRKLMEGPPIRRGGAERKQEWKTEREKEEGMQILRIKHTGRKADQEKERDQKVTSFLPPCQSL